MGVVAAVLVAALLLHLVLAGFFDDLLRSVFERAFDLVVSLVTSAGSGSLSELVADAWSTLSIATAETAGWGWGALVGVVGDVASGAASAWSAVTTVASPLLDAAGDGLRWAGGPISGFWP